MNEDFFRGHFPGHPIMPGVLQLEAMAQVAGIVLLKQAELASQVAYFMSAEDVKWRKPVLPGDTQGQRRLQGWRRNGERSGSDLHAA